MKLYFFCALFFTYSASNAQKAEVAFTIKEKDLIPEGIAYDPADKVFFVGSIHKKKIVKISARGSASDFAVSPRIDLGEVLGMRVDPISRKLWVCNNSPRYDSSNFTSSVHVFDLRTGALLKKYQVSGKQKHLFNDVIISSSGDAYITDTDGGSIYVVRKSGDILEEFLKPRSIGHPNGIALSPDETKLLVSTGSNLGIISIDISTKEIAPLQHEKYFLIGIDGMYRSGQTLIAIQNVTYPESVLTLSCNADFSQVESIKTLVMGLPQLDIPTTGVIVDKYFYFIANSQLLQHGEKGSLKDAPSLKETVIMRVTVN